MTKQQTTVHASPTDPFSRSILILEIVSIIKASRSIKSLLESSEDSAEYKTIAKIGEGSYSEVLKCKNRESGSVYACKRLKHCYRSWNQVNDIPEIVTLRKLSRHPNILQMVEIHFDPTAGRVSLVFELMDMNLYELIKDRKRLLPETRVRVMMFQLMRALRHLHKHGIFHRDVKPENILLKNDLLKLGDLGSVRGLYSRPPYTEYISTRWYRSPECLLTCGYYSFKMDVWAAGCVFYEVLTLRPLFPGSSELDQINRIHNVLGPPPTKILQKFSKHAEIERDYSRHSSKQARLDTIKRVLSDMKNSNFRNFDWYFTGKEPKGVNALLPTHVTAEAKELLMQLLQYDPDSRPSSHRALQHTYFKDLREQAQRAARDKPPAQNGPIVTIVGDEGGLEVTADDNANPVDLATLGDAKLKLKPPIGNQYHNSQTKGITVSPSSRKTLADSKPKLPFEKSIRHLNEAGEAYSREPKHPDRKALNMTSTTYDSKRTDDDKSKLTTNANANLRFGGDAATTYSLPYQKIFAHDDQDGDGPTTKGASSAAQLEARRKHSPLSHRRLGSKIEIERKKSVTSISQNTPASRSFPLEFIDKTTLTPDLMVRINENRRIAHMQPIAASDMKKLFRDKDINGNIKMVVKQNKSPPRSFQLSSPKFQQRNAQKPFRADHTQVTSSKKDITLDSLSVPPTSNYVQQIVKSKQVKEVPSMTKNDQTAIKPFEEKTKELDEHCKITPNPCKITHSKNQLIKNLSALRTKFEAESQESYLSNNRDKKLSKDLASKRNKPSYTSVPQKLKVEQMGDRHAMIGPRELCGKRRSEYSQKDDRLTYKQRVEKLSSTRRFERHERTSDISKSGLYEKGFVHRYELNPMSDCQTTEPCRSPPERRDNSDRKSEREKNLDENKSYESTPRDRHRYEYQYAMSMRRHPVKTLDNDSYRSRHITPKADHYDNVEGFSPSSLRHSIENRRRDELMTTDTDGEGDSCTRQKRLDSERRRKKSNHVVDSPSKSVALEESTVKNNFSPRTLLQPPHTERKPAGMAATTRYSNSGSLANKHVREILTEMRKRRDLLEEKITKDTHLTTWSKQLDVQKAKMADSALKITRIGSRDEFYEPYSMYRGSNNRPSYPRKKQNVTSVAELSPVEKLIQRRRPEGYSYSKIKLVRPEPMPKYGDYEGKAKTSEKQKNAHQSSTGAGSNVFPRNRYGSNVKSNNRE